MQINIIFLNFLGLGQAVPTERDFRNSRIRLSVIVLNTSFGQVGAL